jgi:tetratricopeptide (TPR) repeat protein
MKHWMTHLAVVFAALLVAGQAQAQAASNVDAIGLLGIAERHLVSGEYREAQRIADGLIDNLERSGNRYHADLVRPLVVRGRALHGQGEYRGAIESYHRAQQINRIDGGLHNPDQVDIVYREAESWVAVGEVERADDLHKYAFEVLTRAHGPNSPELVSGLYKIGDWHMRTHSIYLAREYYEHAAAILVEQHGAESREVIPALKGVVNSYRLERMPPPEALEPAGPTFTVTSGTGIPRAPTVSEPRRVVNRYGQGEAALRQIVLIREADPETTTEELVQAYLDLADWNVVFDRHRDAHTLYRYARQLWIERGGDPVVVAAHFDRPVPIYLPLPQSTRSSRNVPEQLTRTGFVELQYSVSDRGRPYDVRAVASDPDVLETRTVRAMRTGIFRPRITDEGAAETRALVYRHTFSYLPDGQMPDASTLDRAGNALENQDH